MSEETKTIQRPQYMAVVKNFAGPGEERPIAFLAARTKRELAEKLKAPEVAEVVGLLRGRRLEHRESRHVAF